MGRGLSATSGYFILGGAGMGYFPFFVNLTKLHGVVIGGGRIALEKVSRLIEYDCRLTVVATKICDEIKAYSKDIELVEESYIEEFLDAADYIIAATDIKELNEQIYHDAKKRGKLINVVDVPDKCDFIFPSVLHKDKLVIGISTSGAGPQVAIRLKDRISEIIPDNIEEILDYLAKERIRAKEEIADPKERREYLIEVANKLLDA